ncbi:MAG: RNA polymerase sigma factor [Chloroflexi bacterium]|nr:RNA polymerase sigma factor [Chloroflexota bacterium]
MTIGMSARAWHDEGVDDRALVEAVLAGERDLFGALVERETPTVFRACLRILGQRQDAEDVTQESFIAAFRAMRSYRGEGSLRAWLLRIATRLAFRRLAQRRSVDALDATVHDRPADPRLEPPRALIVTEQRHAVRGAVASLPDPYREVVALGQHGALVARIQAALDDEPLPPAPWWQRIGGAGQWQAPVRLLAAAAVLVAGVIGGLALGEFAGQVQNSGSGSSPPPLVSPSSTPSPTSSPSPTLSPTPTASPSPTAVSPVIPTQLPTAEPFETPEASESDSSGPGGGNSGPGGGNSGPGG